jgi:hypothetical protein
MAVVATRSRLEGRNGRAARSGASVRSAAGGPWAQATAGARLRGIGATRPGFGAQSAQTEFALTKLLGGTQPP